MFGSFAVLLIAVGYLCDGTTEVGHHLAKMRRAGR